MERVEQCKLDAEEALRDSASYNFLDKCGGQVGESVKNVLQSDKYNEDDGRSCVGIQCESSFCRGLSFCI